MENYITEEEELPINVPRTTGLLNCTKLLDWKLTSNIEVKTHNELERQITFANIQSHNPFTRERK